MHAIPMGIEAPMLRTLPDLTVCISSSGCSSVSFIISFNKLVTLSVSLSSVSHSSKLIEHKEGVMGTSDLQASQAEIVANLGTYDSRLASEVGSSLVGQSP